MKHKIKLLSLLLAAVMLLSVCCSTAISATEPDPQPVPPPTYEDKRDEWWADAAWRAEFEAWVQNYYTTAAATDHSVAHNTVIEIGSVAELYAFWRVTLDRQSNVSDRVTAYKEANPLGEGESYETAYPTAQFTNLTTFAYKELNDSYYATRYYFKLTADLDLEGAEWPGILMLSGTFDGNGYTISNFKLTKPTTQEQSSQTGKHVLNTGFFRNAKNIDTNKNTTVKNLILDHFTISTSSTGTTAGDSLGTGFAYNTGGLIGAYHSLDAEANLLIDSVMLTNAEVELSSSIATAPGKTLGVGGVIGTNVMSVSSYLKIKDTLFQGTVTAKYNADVRLGGFMGSVSTSALATNDTTNPQNSIFENCINLAQISLASNVTNNSACARVWAGKATNNPTKTYNKTCISHFTYLDDEKIKATSTVSYEDWKITSWPITDSESLWPAEAPERARKGSWYADEVYGVIPAGIANNLLYPMYLQLTEDPAEDGTYGLRILGLLHSDALSEIKEIEVTVRTKDANDTEAEYQTVENLDPISSVYTSIFAAGQAVSAESLGAVYLYGVELEALGAGTNVALEVTVTKTLSDDETVTLATHETVVAVPASASDPA